MKFAKTFATLILVFTFTFVIAGSVLVWDNKIADLATGAFISLLTLAGNKYLGRDSK